MRLDSKTLFLLACTSLLACNKADSTKPRKKIDAVDKTTTIDQIDQTLELHEEEKVDLKNPYSLVSHKFTKPLKKELEKLENDTQAQVDLIAIKANDFLSTIRETYPVAYEPDKLNKKNLHHRANATSILYRDIKNFFREYEIISPEKLYQLNDYGYWLNPDLVSSYRHGRLIFAKGPDSHEIIEEQKLFLEVLSQDELNYASDSFSKLKKHFDKLGFDTSKPTHYINIRSKSLSETSGEVYIGSRLAAINHDVLEQLALRTGHSYQQYLNSTLANEASHIKFLEKYGDEFAKLKLQDTFFASARARTVLEISEFLSDQASATILPEQNLLKLNVRVNRNYDFSHRLIFNTSMKILYEKSGNPKFQEKINDETIPLHLRKYVKGSYGYTTESVTEDVKEVFGEDGLDEFNLKLRDELETIAVEMVEMLDKLAEQ